MASSPKFVCLFFILTTLVFSLQTYARDSHFFSKVSRNRDEAPTTTPNTNKFFTNSKENEFEPLNKQQEQEEEPTFIPQTTETGYGLYGHETGLNPPATTSTTTSLYNMDENNNNNNNNNKNNFDDFDSYFKNINEDHEKNYAPELKGLSSTTYSTNVAPTKYFKNNNNNNNYNNDDKQGKYYYNNNNDEKNGKYYFNGGAKYNDVQEKQGMSDTRFLENGKYYYDVNGEKTYEPNNNYMSHSNNYNNNFETNGYYGNNKANRFDAYYDAYYRNNKNNNNNNNNNNDFFSGNGMQGYRNQVPQEEEFAFDDQP